MGRQKLQGGRREGGGGAYQQGYPPEVVVAMVGLDYRATELGCRPDVNCCERQERDWRFRSLVFPRRVHGSRHDAPPLPECPLNQQPRG